MNNKFLRLMALIFVAILLNGCADLLKQKKTAEYEQIVTTLKPIDGVWVDVSYQGGVFYRVQVKNSLPTAITLLWDNSSYVSTSSQSVRVIRVLDRNKLPEQLHLRQADSPIPGGSQLVADFVGESWMKLARSGVTPKPRDGFKKARIYLYFDIKGKRVDWQGEVVFVPKKQPS